MPRRGTSESRFVFEIDGIAAIRASEVSGISKEHTPFELFEGNVPNPTIGRGNFRIGEVTVRMAHALNEAGREFMQWIDDYLAGVDLEQRGARLLIMDEDGLTPLFEYELQECVPLRFEVDTHTGGGNNPSYFRFNFRPTDMRLI